LVGLWTGGGQINYSTAVVVLILAGYTLILVLPVQKFRITLGGVEGEVREETEVTPLSEREEDASIREAISRSKDPSDADKVLAELKKEQITIDSTPLLGDRGVVWRVPYKQFRTIGGLLNSIWASLPRDTIKPYTYGQSWLLKDDKGRILYNIGRTSTFARRVGRGQRDTRSLEEVEITRGTRLYVISPSET